MVFTEIKQLNENKYYYRVRSFRNGKKVTKKRIYLGVNLSPENLLKKEKKADNKLNPTSMLLEEELEPKTKPNIEIDYSLVKILTGSDLSKRKLPIMKIQSQNPGPVIWLTACSHGDEVGGSVVIHEIFKIIRKIGLLKGTIYAIPLMNPLGFETASRHVTFSEEDLNRSFVGDEHGSLAERIANLIFTEIIRTSPDLVLDLHNDWINSIPHVLIDPLIPGLEKTYEKIKFLAEKSELPMILDTEEIEKSLSYSLFKNKIPAITFELGGAHTVNELDIMYGVRAIWKILLNLGLVSNIEPGREFPTPKEIKGKILMYSQKPTCSTSGILRFMVHPGEIIEKNHPIAKVYNAFGQHLETLYSIKKAIILGYADYSIAFPGSPVMSFGTFN
ncbi:MAG: succinylglutamate desuccinylase/aspartoacylase family protein [Candidatus Pacearchaeota archaeon]